ncbi:DUF86 domain-containing protein [Sphingomonas sp. SUN039]|uniref:HepT-like ribonuclease domain-containing protein n=1 Tax=Sphingomonas sp. SUN039 TaxID=2937787 RepID=UPI00216430CE|nr:HepT-like ribonuclease domain-containing protein [Sphingomonas sp. SUN039]UVO54317.1 DUF86 domain-containing protein [Sphingomonas sp. SUN039]
MPSSDEAQRLRDIVENIDNARAYVGERNHAAFAADQMRVDAVERCIERMAEAMIKIGEARMGEIAPDIPLPALRQLGNILRHEYGEVDIRLIHAIVAERMPMLRAACDRALNALGDQ